MTDELYDFQKDGVKFLKSTPRAILADECGLGKTAQAIIASMGLSNQSRLIICPASVKYNWQREIKKWNKGSSVYIVNSKTPGKIPNVKYIIVNYDIVHAEKVFLQLIGRTYGAIILDECHYLKNNRTRRTKSVYYPKGLASRSHNVWGLTGTPVLNRPVELFSHLKALAPERLGIYKSYNQFTKWFCKGRTRQITVWSKKLKRKIKKNIWDDTGADHLGELVSMLDGFMLRREKKDVMKDLPEKTIQIIELQASKKLQKLTDIEREGYEKSKDNILGELASVRRESGVLKVPLVIEHVKNLLEEKEKIVIFAYHKDVIKLLRSALAGYGVTTITGATPAKRRLDCVDTFRTSQNVRVFIGQIEAAGTGIDGLQNVCDTIVFAETDWVPGKIAQAIDRCHRIGQKNAVLIQFLIVEGSIDEQIIESVSRKTKVIDQIVKANVEEPQPKEEPKMVQVQLKINVDAGSSVDAITKVGKALKGVGDLYYIDAMDSLPAASVTTAPVVAKAEPAVAKAEPAESVVKEEAADFGDAGEGTAEPLLTPQEFVAYCNDALKEIEDVKGRQAKVKTITAMFKKKYKQEKIKDLPAEKIAAAKIDFDAIMSK